MEGDAGCPPLRVGTPAGSEHSGWTVIVWRKSKIKSCYG